MDVKSSGIIERCFFFFFGNLSFFEESLVEMKDFVEFGE